VSQQLRLRAALFGALLSALVGWTGVNISQDFSTGGAVFYLFIIVGLVSPVLGRFRQGWRFSRQELALLYGMLVCSSACVMGYACYFPVILTAPVYFAKPENQWGEALVPYLKPWLFVTDPVAVESFYEGGSGVPWRLWIGPLAAWITFFIVLSFVMLCIMVVLRKPWEESERLSYPIAQLPLSLIEKPAGYAFPVIFHRPLFWLGFGLVFALGSLNGLHGYFPDVPQAISVWGAPSIQLFPGGPKLIFRVSFLMIGFTYLVSAGLSFSVWFLFLVTMAVRAVFEAVGYRVAEPMDVYSHVCGGPFFSHFQTGALVALVAVGLWMARFHIRRVLSEACRTGGTGEDIMSARAACGGIVGGFAFLTAWLWLSGLNLFLAVAFLLAAIVLFVGITRVVVQGGIAETKTPISPFTAVISAFGSASAGPSSMASLGAGYVWAADTRSLFITSSAHALKVWDVPRRPRGQFLAIGLILAVCVSFLANVLPRVVSGYHSGYLNAVFVPDIDDSFNYIARGVLRPAGPSWTGWWITGLGASVFVLFAFLTQRFVWWPIHPLGVPIAAVWLTQQIWFSVFLAWFIKMTVLRYGGRGAFKKSVPFFLGIILGQFSAVGVWFFIDKALDEPAHVIFWL
jgi:hypothetical protein